jgi:hypothetical protein
VSSPRRLFILLIAVAAIVRLGWALSRPPELAADLPDQHEYLTIARNLLAGNGLRFFDDRFGDEVVAFRAPGYPLLMAALGANIRVIRSVQGLLDASVVVAIYLLARRFLPAERWLPLVAAALVAFNPYLVYFSSLLLSETLFTALLAWGIVLASWKKPTVPAQPPVEKPPEPPPSVIPMARQDVSPPPPQEPKVVWPIDWAPIAGAIVLSLAVLTRPGAMILPAAVMAVAAWATGRRLLPQLLLGAGVTFLTLLPWAYRNHQLLGAWIWTTTNAGHTAYDGFGPSATGKSDLRDLRTMRSLQPLGEVARDRVLRESAGDWMRSDLGRSTKLAVVKAGRTWSPMPLSEGYSNARNIAIGLAYSLPLFVLTLVGLLRRAISVPAKALCLLPAVYFTGIVMISVGSLRYRIPAEPPMAVVAAAGLRRNKLPVGSC